MQATATSDPRAIPPSVIRPRTRVAHILGFGLAGLFLVPVAFLVFVQLARLEQDLGIVMQLVWLAIFGAVFGALGGIWTPRLEERRPRIYRALLATLTAIFAISLLAGIAI